MTSADDVRRIVSQAFDPHDRPARQQACGQVVRAVKADYRNGDALKELVANLMVHLDKRRPTGDNHQQPGYL